MARERTEPNTYEVLKLSLLAVIAAVVAVAVFSRGDNAAQAQGMPAVGGGNYVFLAAQNGQNAMGLVIVDQTTRRFAFYSRKNGQNDNMFTHYITRHFGPDLELDDVSQNSNGNSVEDMVKLVARGGERKRK